MAFTLTWIYLVSWGMETLVSWGMETSPGPLQLPDAGALS
jgi:hypothetical protein